MKHLSNIAIIGSGPTAIYLLQNINKHIDVLKVKIKKITIFEKEKITGMGMPYNPKTTDIYNLANISSEEIPLLQQTFANWLQQQDKLTLSKLNITETPIDEKQVYSRVALGHYFHHQFKQLINNIIQKGINVVQISESEVKDISKSSDNQLTLTDSKQKKYTFSTVIIANGHEWKEEDKPKSGYYSSPWPIHKLLPTTVHKVYNFPVGTLGASLSAFDVVTSLSHRHGKFIRTGKALKFIKHKNAPNFKMVLHASEGWLPHLQYEQQEPIREIYRHFSREDLLAIVDKNGSMCIENYFDKLCRSVLAKAFAKDKLHDVTSKLNDVSFSFKDLVNLMSKKHKYTDSFEGMKLEMKTARKSIEQNIPIHWMETLDDLMYSLNYHAELLAAEDHLYFRKEIMSFLMNVIAALPLQSAEILLALHDADCIDLKAGRVSFPENAFQDGKTTIKIKTKSGAEEQHDYKLFINCGGQKKMELENYPFQSLVKDGTVREATAAFSNKEYIQNNNINEEDIIKIKGTKSLKLSGIDIDSSYRTINKDGTPNDFLYDINFTHTNGLRPYSYGLQACNATSMILVKAWIARIVDHKTVGDDIEKITQLYDKVDDL